MPRAAEENSVRRQYIERGNAAHPRQTRPPPIRYVAKRNGSPAASTYTDPLAFLVQRVFDTGGGLGATSIAAALLDAQ